MLECLVSIQEALGWSSTLLTAWYSYNPRRRSGGRSRVQGHQLRREFKASLAYMRLYLKQANKQTTKQQNLQTPSICLSPTVAQVGAQITFTPVPRVMWLLSCLMGKDSWIKQLNPGRATQGYESTPSLGMGWWRQHLHWPQPQRQHLGLDCSSPARVH